MYGSTDGPAPRSRGNPADSPFQRSDMSRPSAKYIYRQRKEYSESINRQPDTFQYRVEHLMSCELDGRELNSVDDCINRLRNVDSRGKVWGQDMILQAEGNSLQLCDIETKEVLESIPLGTITQTQAILDACTYDSILSVMVQGSGRRPPNVLLFQCEETGPEDLKTDLDRAIQNKGDDPGFHANEPSFDLGRNLDNIIGQGYPGSFRRPGSPPMYPSPPPEYPSLQGNAYREYEDFMPQYGSRPQSPRRDEPRYSPDMHEPNHMDQPSPTPSVDVDRNAEVFNHLVTDIELFMEKVGVAVQQEENSNPKKKKKKSKPRKYGETFPSIGEFVACLQKIKYAFNLLGQLDGQLNASTADFVHGLFSTLGFLVTQYPSTVPPSVVSPLLIEPAIQLLSQMLSPQENQLWNILGDAWHVPRSKWPNADSVQPYIPVFSDGWEPPVPARPQSAPSRALSRSNSQNYPPMNGVQQQPMQDNRPFGGPPPRSPEPQLHMRVIYDFIARNHQELSVVKGEVVQVVDKSRQWWVVRNNRQEEGHVPPNVLEPMGEEEPARMNRPPNLDMRSNPDQRMNRPPNLDMRSSPDQRMNRPPNLDMRSSPDQRMNRPPNLDMRSSPEEVRAWLQYKGFSKMTVRSLSMMNGAVLLGLKRDDIRALCPEEGGRVFFQLQGVKSALALASEPEYNQYGGR